jgi:hypothetical protein
VALSVSVLAVYQRILDPGALQPALPTAYYLLLAARFLTPQRGGAIAAGHNLFPIDLAAQVL